MKIKLMIMLTVCTFSCGAIASDVHEKMYLTQMLNQLESLKPLIHSANREQDKHTRMQFHYHGFRDANGIFHNGILEDINAIENGIRTKLNQQSREPRYFQPIKGDYWDAK